MINLNLYRLERITTRAHMRMLQQPTVLNEVRYYKLNYLYQAELNNVA